MAQHSALLQASADRIINGDPSTIGSDDDDGRRSGGEVGRNRVLPVPAVVRREDFDHGSGRAKSCCLRFVGRIAWQRVIRRLRTVGQQRANDFAGRCREIGTFTLLGGGRSPPRRGAAHHTVRVDRARFSQRQAADPSRRPPGSAGVFQTSVRTRISGCIEFGDPVVTIGAPSKL